MPKTHSFNGLLLHLNREPSTLRLPSDHTDHTEDARASLERGYVAAPSEMRRGNPSVCWYRGPLAPGPVDQASEPIAARPTSADKLVRYDKVSGMFDVSYVAAWQLGRLLTQQNQKVAVSLLDWKRRHRFADEPLRAERKLEHLPMVGRPVATEIPADLERWFADLALLRGVPFNYLVPDERMLPRESIRFFRVDREWIRCLHDGALSVGRELPADHEREAEQREQPSAPHEAVTGLLLHSELVSAWPDLRVEGYDEAVANAKDELSLLRMDRLSPSILLCLFAGEIQTADIHQ
jgi:hypothetical protein